MLGLALGGGYLIAGRALPILPWFERDIAFEDMTRPAGFRRVRAGETSSAGFDPFAGIGGAAPTETAISTMADVERDICAALFEGWSPGSGTVPIASFSDYNCPICRVTTRRIARAAPVRDGTARVTWHELPILGETSVLAAKAALAADNQGAYAAFQDRLLRSAFQPTDGYVDALASDLGLDRDRLARDMVSPDIKARIDRSLALRDLFGFRGTPAILVGRTVVEGDIGDAALSRLIELELEGGAPPAC
ncbi:MAG: thioredoxin domain-containing protein [Litorimonas sp.]